MIALLVGYIVGQYFRFSIGPDSHPTFIRLFDLSRENNIPSWFSANLLFCSALLLFTIGYLHNISPTKHRTQWSTLGILFMFLSLDESASLHELLSYELQTRWHTTGIFYFAWVIPYSILTLGCVLYFFPFVLSRTPLIRNLIMVSGLIYLTGALGFELFESHYFYLHNSKPMFYAALVCMDEVLEMSGIILFLYTLLFQLQELRRDQNLSLEQTQLIGAPLYHEPLWNMTERQTQVGRLYNEVFCWLEEKKRCQALV